LIPEAARCIGFLSSRGAQRRGDLNVTPPRYTY
jgi:hypothetical protein